MDELWRVCKNGAMIDIYVPHFSGVYAFKHIAHYHYFGLGTFDIMLNKESFAGERYNKAKFDLADEKLIFWCHNSEKFKWVNRAFPDFLLNFGRLWQQMIERFAPIKIDEIHYRLRVTK